MKNTVYVFLMLLLSAQAATAQSILERVKSKTKAKTEQRAEQKLDEGIDKGLDKLEGLFGKKKKSSETVPAESNEGTYADQESTEEKTDADMAMLRMMGKPGTEDFSYQHQLTYTIENYKKDDLEAENKITVHYGESNTVAMVMPYEEDKSVTATFIFDASNKRILTLIDQPEMKMGMEYSLASLPTANDYAEEGEANEDQYSFRKTGRTKSIFGYACTEYALTQGKTEGLVWMCNDDRLPKKMYKMFGAMAAQTATALPQGMPTGFMMEAESWPNGKDGKEYTHMVVTQIGLHESASFSSKPYTIIKM